MSTSLTSTGIFWACLSLGSAILNGAGFFLPFWIEGTTMDNSSFVYFGSFRRCNYPKISEDTGQMYIVEECGRYTNFSDIPSLAWQISTIITGIGATLSLLIAFTAISGCFTTDVITKRIARIAGGIQILSGLLIVVGCCVYPLGWNSTEVKNACGGRSDSFRLGSCQFSWSIYIMSAGVGLLIFCAGLSIRASTDKYPYRI
ncbi:LHFP (predicted) [Pycnogonum litorale]